MANSSDFTLDACQEILKFIFGKTVKPQHTLPLHTRWLEQNDATSVTPGTEVSFGASSRFNLNYGNAQLSYSEPPTWNSWETTTGNQQFGPIGGGPVTIRGNEIWDASTPSRRICYANGSNTGFTVNGGDHFEWDDQSSGIALRMMGFDSNVVKDSLNWVLGKTTGWTRPVAPFKIKLKQYDDFQNVPKATLEAAPMQTVTFGPVGVDSDNQATILSDIEVYFPPISATQDVVVQGYEIWDSSSTPRRIASRKPGQDYIRDGQTFSWAYIAAGESLTIPLGSIKISLGRGDNI